MIMIVISIALIHVLFLLVWVILNKVKAVVSYTNDLKEYTKCSYPLTRNVCTIINLTIVGFCIYLFYIVKDIGKYYKDKMSIPVYIYILYIILIEVLSNIEEVSVITIDIFDSVGSTVNSIVTIYFLYFTRLKDIHKEQKVKLQFNKSNTIIRSTDIL
ncbi:hypothetical protein H8356DRAFT_962981 [Neocallimastix lanati (nom. inval.)]|uniref:G-protein coupled receptors family 3 profile domain-containing protein n=1 Tax=Neocallimastix californiae TaxID=1754190 RepID=A0A1Y2DDJ9_9FUNG|nr:hypothetical protein H8356DRAFT_962981 [Neocallimastix sp. JGI-2020a]ORY57340.1 hypothetical protein LY90DRAFT_506494 [Neocallimastix californiae]|eukprot:ORY57340.1 hypothetical protein LY90DRAFT_506494 [Neocallimastix californiae]